MNETYRLPGHHIETDDTPSGPMDMWVANEGYPLKVDLLSGTVESQHSDELGLELSATDIQHPDIS